MLSRESTNAKLASIIQSNEDDQDEEELYRVKEKQARLRLQRARLYNGGARTKVPKLKKMTATSQSPFVLVGAATDAAPPKPLTSSNAPSAHDDMYRMVSNPTQAALRDPDRICYNSTTMVEGLRVLPQPPWYFGYNNNTVPPDSNHIMSANRYGFRGSCSIQQFNVKPYEPPSRTTTQYTPGFLAKNDDYVNEYVPPIVGARHQTTNGLESPKLWPENATYVEGFRNKQRAKSWFYKRETTVDQLERPKSPQSLSDVVDKVREEAKLLRDYATMEAQGTMLSRPTAELRKFEKAWGDQLRRGATTSLKKSLREVHAPYESHTLLDPSDVMRYSGSTALIVHSQTTEELKFRLRMERSQSKATSPFALRWQHATAHFNNVRHKLKRGQSMTEIIDKIGRSWQTAALRAGSETSIRRADFVQACSRIAFFEDVSAKQMSQLYSLFDPARKNAMRFVEVLLCFVVLDRPELDLLHKIRVLWMCATQFGLDRDLFDLALDVLSCCAASRQDQQTIEALFRSEFRPQCYQFAVVGHGDKTDPSGVLTAQTEGSTVDSAGVEANAASANARPSSAPALAVTAFVKHQYNICESQLNADTVATVLQGCTQLLKEFDSQLSARLLACYGRDDRYKEPEPLDTPAANLDFSWIMRKEAPKREVIGLFESM